MAISKELFKRTSAAAVEKELRRGKWRVYHEYEVHYPERSSPYVRAVVGLDDLSYDEYCDEYTPLVDYPTLFLKFARLADEGEITQEAWLEWVRGYGVLGLDPDISVRTLILGGATLGLGEDDLLREFKEFAAMNREYMGSHTRMEGTPVENYDRFVYEANRANELLKVYETVNEDDPDVELIKSFSPGTDFSEEWMTPQWMKWLGRFEVRGYVDWMLRHECYPTIYPVGEESSLGWAFDSLLGAMYLQMAWLLIAKEEIHCKQCGRVINFEQPEIPWERLLKQKGRRKPYKTRSDTEYCSKSCANKWYYEHVRKPRLVRQ